MDSKASLRAELLRSREERPAQEREQAGRELAQQALLEWLRLPAVIAYAAVGTEPPTRHLLDRLQECGVAVWLPVVVGPQLYWAPYAGWDALVAGPAGLLEPAGPRTGPEPPAEAALWLVPALAVDRTGVRLGRGGGYYDRTLAGKDQQQPRVVAVVYETELVEQLPREPHDVLVDAALLPTGHVTLGVPDPSG